MLLRYKKLISYLLVFFILDFNIFSVDAGNIFMDAMLGMSEEENIETHNIDIKYDEISQKHYMTVKDISKGTGQCIYKDIDVDKIKVKFYHKLSTVAYKDESSSDTKYFLGCGDEEDKNYQVKYLPNNEKYGKLKDGLYIKPKGKPWRKCVYEDEKYIFEDRGENLNNKLNDYEEDLLDYGLNICVSKDGKKFKKLKSEPSIIKETQEIDENDEVVDIGTDRYLEEMVFDDIPKNTRYIKIELTETSSLIDDSGENELDVIDNDIEPLMSIYKIQFSLRNVRIGISEEDVRRKEKGTETEKNKSKEKSMQTRKMGISNKYIFGISEEETDQMDYKVRTKKSKLAKNKKIISNENKNILGSSKGNVRRNNNDGMIVYKYQYPKNNKKKRVKFVDSDKNNKVNKNENSRPSYLNKNNKNNQSNKKIYNPKEEPKAKSDFINEMVDDDRYDENFKEDNESVSVNNKNLNKNTYKNRKYNKRNIKKDIDEDVIISDDIKINNDPDDLIKFVNQSDDLISEKSQYEDKDEINKEEEQIKKEKTVGKIYLSSLFVTLGSILTYDKIGLIRKFLKF